MYTRVIKPILFQFNPETVHEVLVFFGETLGRLSFTQAILGFFYIYKGPSISKIIDTIEYKTPFILSAGFDYNARLTHILPYIGLGGVEVGSVTARPCAGNPKPRLTRLPKSKSILVNKGLRNEGVDAIIRRLKSRPQENNFVVGVSIARTNDEKSASLEEGIRDYCYSFKRLNDENVGDYYTLNISCPNAFGGETFAVPHLLEKLLGEIKKIPCSKPVYVKMPINISWDVLNELISLVVKYSFSGVIIGNLQKDYETLEFREEAPREYHGGLSGKPCFHPSNNLIKKARAQYGNLTIVGCGGILSPVDALYKFEIGSDLVHLITGIIFEGPGLVKKMCRAYSDSHTSVEREEQKLPPTLHATIGL